MFTVYCLERSGRVQFEQTELGLALSLGLHVSLTLVALAYSEALLQIIWGHREFT